MTLEIVSASRKDHKSRATIKWATVQGWFALGKTCKRGDRFLVSVMENGRTHDLLFYCNRDNETLKTTSWASGLPTPKVGSPINIQATLIVKI